MDVNLDEDFVNFESVSQTCGSSMSLMAGVDEELILLDSEVSRREHQYRDEKREKNNNDDRLNACDQISKGNVEEEGRYFGQSNFDEEKTKSNSSSTSPSPSEESLFTSFPFGAATKRLTMMPGKCKLKDERRKVLKISVNKLKKIEDPESWLYRSVLINNTMRKLQKETRDERVNRHASEVSVTLSSGFRNGEYFDGRFSHDSSDSVSGRNNIGDDEGNGGVVVGGRDRLLNAEAFVKGERGDVGCASDVAENGERHSESRLMGEDVAEALLPIDEILENEFLSERENKLKSNEGTGKSRLAPSKDRSVDLKIEVTALKERDSVYEGGSFVEKFSSTKRCASRKISLDEDESAVVQAFPRTSHECGENPNAYDADECDVHDVLGQLYMPPTPKMVTSIDSDTDEDELNVVDVVDSSHVEHLKFPRENSFEKYDYFEDATVRRVDELRKRCRDKELPTTIESVAKRRRSVDDEDEDEDEDEDGEGFGRGREALNVGEKAKEEGVIGKKVSRSLTVHYQHKSTGDGFFEENNCDNQYSCGHAVTMFGSDLQTVVFNNLIPGLET